MKKKIENCALGVFFIGFVAMVIILTLSNYRLTLKILSVQGSGDKYEALTAAAEEMIEKTYDTNYEFIRDLKRAIEQANVSLIEKYDIPEWLDEKIAEASRETKGYVYHPAVIDQILPPQNDIAAFQNHELKDYTAWLQDKSFEKKSDLTKELNNAVHSINDNLAYKIGFDDYAAKNLLFSITKASTLGMTVAKRTFLFLLSFGLMIIGALVYYFGKYAAELPGINNNGIFSDSLTAGGRLGMIVGSFMITFYIVLYFYPEYLTNWVIMVDPISYALNGGPASHWFLYGFMYTLAILTTGVRMILKYRHIPYQILRTLSVMLFQTAFAFIIPEILVSLRKPGFDFKNIWPLDYDFFYGYHLESLMQSGMLGWFMLFWGIGLIIVAVPVITYFFGKRWYCSWICGCGALAETLGDPFRQLSDKSLKAWKIERWMIHAVLAFAVINTAAVLYTFFSGSYSIFGISTESIKSSYGFLISSVFAGVVGTGFYPLMGNRVWCRYGCPLAAYLGIVQRFKSRFRITANGGQCISCGNCSTYCEMGIDVRWYAQRGQNIVRSSCVGCGVCSAVCPRGVLKLENGPEKTRVAKANPSAQSALFAESN